MPDKAIIVGANILDSKSFSYEMEELKNLCIACEIEVVESVTQNLRSIHPKTYVGLGKVEEIKMIANSLDADVVVFNDELTPSQINSLEELLEITIYDRTYVILEIFKRRASTKVAMLQVDIASLKYMLPRLVGLRQGLSRQRGAGGGGAHGRGQGETKLELDRRNINDRIAYLNNELKELTKDRFVQRQKRLNNAIPIVSLVGYTNSGKSSTLNALLGKSSAVKKEVFQKDMLFATLETSSRLIKLENNHEFILTDTVGFISKLPHQLVEAFKSTLEEITEADLILHIVDASNPNYEDQINTTNKVLEEIGVKNIPVIYVFNKIDLIDHYFYIPPQYENALRISATAGTNLNGLISSVEEELYKHETTVTCEIPYSESKLVAQLKNEAKIITIEYLDDFVLLKAQLSITQRAYVEKYIKKEE